VTIIRRMQGRSELGVAVLLGVFGAVVLWNALWIVNDVSQRGVIGPKVAPVLVGGLLMVCAVLLAREVLRGAHSEVDVSADDAGGDNVGAGVDPSHRSDWRTVLLLSAAFLANAALIEWAGWVISGTVLFWGSAYALGNRAYFRDLVIAVVLAVSSFYLFVVGLGITLPAGILTGIL
jgi:putative tricarboxylic transport membrane protein